MLDAQDVDTGNVPNGSPWQLGCGGGVARGAAICMPLEFYMQYSALDMLEYSYEPMKNYIGYMQTWVNNDGILFSKRKGADGEILKCYNLGEWNPPGELVRDDFVHTFYYLRCLDITAKTTMALGKDKESGTYRLLSKSTKKAFRKAFYDPEKKTYVNGGGNIFALKMGVPQEQYKNVKLAFVKNITDNNGHLDTEIFGTCIFFEVLAENGLNGLAYASATKTDELSFGRWLAVVSTTTREKWYEGGFFNPPIFCGVVLFGFIAI